MSGYSIGIDLGGTNIKIIAVTTAGATLCQESRPTQDEICTQAGSVPIWAQEVKDLLQSVKLTVGCKPNYLGFAAPGLASEDGRSIAFMPGRLAGLEGFDWSSFLEHDVYVVDDAKAAMLGEIWQGAAKGFADVIMITLGTGVGGAIYAGGRLIRGHIGRAGNLGHMSLDTDGLKDVSGMPGSLENAIGNCTIYERSAGRFDSTRALVEAAQNGDKQAEEVWNQSVYKLACALAAYVNILDPQAIVIGGGIAKAGDLLFERLDAYLEKIEWRPNGHKVLIKAATLGEWAGAIGTAYNAILEGNH